MSSPSDYLRISLVKAIVLAVAAPRPRYQLENMILAQILSFQKHNTNTCHKIFAGNMFSVNSCCGTTISNLSEFFVQNLIYIVLVECGVVG